MLTLLYVSTAHSPRLLNSFNFKTSFALLESQKAPGNTNGGASGLPRTTPSKSGAVAWTASSADHVGQPTPQDENAHVALTKVLVRESTGVDDESPACSRFDLQRRDKCVCNVSDVDVFRGVVVDFVVLPGSRQVSVHEI